ncbi:hypothetical protein PYW07_015630 [Mythimna separata]|uniref:Interferon-related developmental regulator N-terminal domain-containing protein n=1 Tax=Mythimna separata TaxID=271217 RepID=A0AAD7YZB8_MYTSE|nr:hypothetical protein PYW07_015630 [Mythimna separata]
MGRPKADINRGFSREERMFCIEQYYLNRKDVGATKRSYWVTYRDQHKRNRDKCPSSAQITAWVKFHEEKEQSSLLWKQPKEQQETETNKLSGTQWGRKTGENRIIRTESVDSGLHQQTIKWRQRDIKWSGPRAVNEKEKMMKTVEEEQNYWNSEEAIEENSDKYLELKEKFEGEILELVEALDARGHAARATAFDSLRTALQRRAVDGLLAGHRATLADHVSRSLWRGKDGERKAAAAIAPLLVVQIGEEYMEDFVREVRPALAAAATDATASLDARTECCSSLAVLCYFMEEDITETLEVMRMYETIFSGSYLKDDGSVKVSGAAVEEGVWHAAALDGWALLFSRLSPNHALSLLNNQEPSFTRLGELLEAVSVEVRMAAGGALAIVYEIVSDDDEMENPLAPHVDVLLPRLTELARDPHKYRAKRDRRVQRATFRDILKYFEDGEAPCTSAHIGTETAEWSSWSGGAAYAALAGALGGALQVLAPLGARLREALQLTKWAPEKVAPQEKLNKLQRDLQYRATRKARYFTRSKNRDKRFAELVI